MNKSLRLPFAAAVAVTVATFMAFFYAPTEAVQGNVQRIFYIHVPSAWVAYLAFFVVAAASVLVLARRDEWERWDAIAVSCVEVGTLFLTIVLTTGPIWAGRAWGVFWAWDVRLTSTLVLWLIAVGYLVFRASTAPGERRARLCAVIGIIGAIDVPLIHFAVDWWASAHPPATVMNFEGGPTLPGAMLTTLFVSLGAFTLLFLALVTMRVRIERARTTLALTPDEAAPARSEYV
jgi:heme exporter protein C